MVSCSRSTTLLVATACVFVLGGLQCGGPSASDGVNVTFEETLALGTDSASAPLHRLFEDPAAVAVGDGRLFAVDRGAPTIRVYDRDGTFRRTLGAAGNAPGEFRRITALYYDDGRLLVADRRQARITALAPSGAVRATYQLPQVPKVTQIAALSAEEYVVVGPGKGHLVHVVDSSFSTVRARLVPESAVRATDHKLETVAVQFFPGHVTVPGPDRIVYAPALYDGTLYNYGRARDTAWTRTATYRGATPPDPPATFGPLTEVERVDLPISLQQGRYGVQFHALSWGLSSGADGTITHVYSRERGEGVELTLERFAADGRRLGAAVVDTASAPTALDVIGMRPDGPLYLSDTRTVPRLRRLSWARPE